MPFVSSASASTKTPGNGGFLFANLNWLLPAVVLLYVLFLYLPSLGYEYVWDDRAFFITSASLRQADFLSAITEPVLAGSVYFRPLVLGMFASELRWFGADPFYGHLGNVVLHIANVLLVGLLARRFGADTWRIVAAMVLYGLSPALIEGVVWISGRFDMAVTFFSLLTLWLATSRHLPLAILSGLAFFAAAVSKEMAVTVPLVTFLFLWAMREPTESLSAMVRAQLTGSRPFIWISLFIAGIAFLALRAVYIHSLTAVDPALLEQLGTVTRRIAFVGLTLGLYVGIMVWPFKDLGPLHPFDTSVMNGVDVAIGLATIAVCIAFAAWAVLRPGRWRLLALASLVALLPVANIVPLSIVGNLGHERFLVFPLALSVLAFVSLPFERLQASQLVQGRGPVIAGVALAIWAVIATLNVKVTLPLWRNDLVLWKWAYGTYPHSQFAQFSYASAALHEQRYDLAKEVIDQAEKAGPLPLRLSISYGQYLIRTGSTAEGLAKIRAGLEGERQPHRDVLKAGIALRDAKLSKQDFGGWLLIYAYAGLAEGDLMLRRFQDAASDAEIALFYQPDNPSAQLLKSFSSYGLDKWDQAQAEFKRASGIYLTDGRASAEKMRLLFLAQLCSEPQATQDVCRKAAPELVNAVVIPSQPIRVQ